MNSKLLKCGVIGVGYLGRFHAQKFMNNNKSDLVSIYDRDTDRAKEIAYDLKINSSPTVDDLLEQVDAVSIAATTSAHYELAKCALDKCKHVFIEKPITATSAQGKELCELAYKNGVKIQVGHIERLNPVFRAFKKELNHQTPVYMEFRRVAPFRSRGADVSVLHDLMIHDLDLALSIDSSGFKNRVASGKSFLTQTLDYASCTIEFNSGSVAHFFSSRVGIEIERSMQVYSQDKHYHLDLGNRVMTEFFPQDKNSETPVGHSQIKFESSDALNEEINAFIDSVLENKPCIVSGEDGVRALEAVEQIVHQIKD